MGMQTQLIEVLSAQYHELDQKSVITVYPGNIADAAYKVMDPDGLAPLMVRCAALLELRQLARSICRHTNVDDQEEERSQLPMFDGDLQRRYPAHRDGEEVYVLREFLTETERRGNVARLRAEGKSKLAHANALELETDTLFAAGKLAGA
jgi:hypothetical protein